MTRIFTDRRCLEHRSPAGLPETSERLTGILEALRAGGWTVEDAGPHRASQAAVLAVHDGDYVTRFERAVARGDGLLDSADNPLSAGTWDAAWGAVDAALAAADHGLDQGAAFAAVRPPGHHAERALAMGFCYFNNIAVAAEYLRRERGVERVAIFDFDVHHGNGTQHLFEERPDILFASTHQYPFYPGTGAAGETGRGAGEGATVNVPLSAGTEDAEFETAVEEIVIPALRRHRPEVLLLSAGFDAWRGDPLGGLRLSRPLFQRLGRRLAHEAETLCSGRMISFLEGGYDLEALPGLVTAYLEGSEGREGEQETRA